MKIIPNMLLTPSDQDVPITVLVRIDDRGPYPIADGEITYDGRPAAILLAEAFTELAATLRASVQDDT